MYFSEPTSDQRGKTSQQHASKAMVADIWHDECTEVQTEIFYSLDWQKFPKYKLFLHENRERSKKTKDHAYIHLESKEEQYAKQKTEEHGNNNGKERFICQMFLAHAQDSKQLNIIWEIKMPT